MDHRPVPGICIHRRHLHIRLSGHGRFGMRQSLCASLAKTPVRGCRSGYPRSAPRDDDQGPSDPEGVTFPVGETSGRLCAHKPPAASAAELGICETAGCFPAHIPPALQDYRQTGLRGPPNRPPTGDSLLERHDGGAEMHRLATHLDPELQEDRAPPQLAGP